MKKITLDSALNSIAAYGKTEKAIVDDATEIARIVGIFSKTRVKKGYSQRDLAELTGLKQSAIARMESLQAIPRLDTLVRVARALNITIDFEVSVDNRDLDRITYINKVINQDMLKITRAAKPNIYSFGGYYGFIS